MNSEKKTRQELIDKKLLQAGWDINNHAQVVEEYTNTYIISNNKKVTLSMMHFKKNKLKVNIL